MRIALLAVALCLTVSGCSSLAGSKHLQDAADVPITVGEINNAFGCEFHYALQSSTGAGHTALENWGAIVELDLSVSDDMKIIPGIGALNANIGNATLTTQPASLTVANTVADTNAMAYFIPVSQYDTMPSCPAQGGHGASNGLELASFLEATAQVINAGGKITSTSTLSSAGFASNGTSIGPGTILPGLNLAAAPADIPTIHYGRTFTVSRSVGGGLSFQVQDISLTMNGSTASRTRDKNTISIIMGDLGTGTHLRAYDNNDDNPLLRSIWKQRSQEVQNVKNLTDGQIVVVTPPTQ